MAANEAAGTPAIPPVRRVRQGTMLAYGFGAVAYGVKDFCFSTFLLLFYNQVLGLPSAQVGFAIMCALLLDAFIDPAIGFLSDRTRGRWGRRHPWMYASARRSRSAGCCCGTRRPGRTGRCWSGCSRARCSCAPRSRPMKCRRRR